VLEVKDGAEAIGWVGQDAVLKSAYFEIKGACTPDVAQAIRKHYGDGRHNVSRCDVAEDYNEAGAFGRLVDLIDRTKGDDRVHSEAIVPRDGDRGQTVYWGARQSKALVRCYEKGKQEVNLHLNRPDWARVELQMRPAKSVEKQLAASLEPLAIWGMGRWTWNIAQELSGIELERFKAPQEPPEFDRTTRYLAETYRRHWEQLLEDFGDWECIGREMQAIWRRADEAKAKSGEGSGAVR
jgi:Replication initiation factor